MPEANLSGLYVFFFFSVMTNHFRVVFLTETNFFFLFRETYVLRECSYVRPPPIAAFIYGKLFFFFFTPPLLIAMGSRLYCMSLPVLYSYCAVLLPYPVILIYLQSIVK